MERRTLGKVCPGCGVFKEFKHYHKNASQRDGHNSRCKDCRAKLHKETYERAEPKPTLGNNFAQKKYRCRVKYGVDVETYDKVMSVGHCEICQSTTDLVYDHDHTTLQPRGCLCRKCNRAIGQLGDTVESLREALRYLEKTNGN